MLRAFARLVETGARPHLPASLPDGVLPFSAISLVGAIERLMIEWQDGELGLSIDQIVDYLVGMLLGAGRLAGVEATTTRRPRRRTAKESRE